MLYVEIHLTERRLNGNLQMPPRPQATYLVGLLHQLVYVHIVSSAGRRSITTRNRTSLVGATAVRSVTHNVSPMTSSPRSHSWSHTETENLLKGVKRFGIGRWKLILDNYEFSERRTAVSLKDKWRNLRGRYNKQ